MSENRLLNRILGPKTEKLLGDWRKLKNKELHNFHYSPNQINEDKMGGLVERIAPMRNAHYILNENPEDKAPLGRPRRRLDDNIKTDFKEIK
jgi:hypothetical protein